MATLHIHPVGLIIILVGLASWVLALGGLAASTKFCADNKADGISCAQVFQQHWWALFFELFLLLAMLFTSFLNVFPRARYVYLTYLAMVTALLSFATTDMYSQSFQQGWLAVDKSSRAYDAAGVGAMFLCMVNFGLIAFIGLGAAKAIEQPAQASFSPVSTQAPATGMGNTHMPGDIMMSSNKMMGGVAPTAPASF